MKTNVINYFDDQTNEHVATRYFIGNVECSYADYAKLMEDMYSPSEDEEIQEQEENYIPCPCIVCTRQREIGMQESLDEEHNACDECTLEGCHGCGEMDEAEHEESLEDQVNELIGEAFEAVMESHGCSNCVMDALLEFGESMMYLGHEEMKQEMHEFIDG